MEQQVFQKIYKQEVPPKELGLIPAVELILSEDVYTLEHRLAQWVGAKHCIAVSDAASGIALALTTAGVSPGETVLCAALGCALPVQGIMLVGASPLFVDINPNTYTLDPYCLESTLNKLRRMGRPVPSALIATDLFGAPCNYAALEEICRSRGIAVIEDLSGAFGAEVNGRPTGSFGRFAVASFANPSPLEELGGGAVFCQRDEDARRLRTLRQTKQQQVLEEPAIPRMGCVDAFLIGARLESCAHQAEQRRRIARIYRSTLADKVRMQQLVRGAKSVYSQMVVALPRSRDRSKVVARLRELNIPAGAPFCGMQTDRNEWNQVMLVNTLTLAGRLLSLPIHPYLSAHLTKHIAHCLLQAMDDCSL